MISQNVLILLEEQLGPDAMAQALDLLVADLHAAADSLSACLDTGDEARARRTGHKLKGILEQYGIRDPDSSASNLAARYDLYWVTEGTALFGLCQRAIDEIRKIQLARAASNDDAIGEAIKTAS